MRIRYMSEWMFNVLVATIVRVHLGTGTPLAELAAGLAKEYRQFLVDDGFETDLVEAGETLAADKPSEFTLRYMQFFFSKYNLDGSKRKLVDRIYRPIMFAGEREPVANRQQRFVVAYCCFIALTETGRVPLPARGWRL